MAGQAPRAPLLLRSAPEVERLANSFNEALTSMNRYLLQSMSGAIISLDTSGSIIGASPAPERPRPRRPVPR